MPVGDCERAFASAASADGVLLGQRPQVAWLNQRGHFGLPSTADRARVILDEIFTALGGQPTEQAAKRLTPLRGDLLHVATGTLIEVDESQHFTTSRLTALSFYPSDIPLGFEIETYRALCRRWAPRSDRYRADKTAVGFGAHGRQCQRAYHDALRDLAAPCMNRPPVIRAAAPDRDGAAAYARVRRQILSL